MNISNNRSYGYHLFENLLRTIPLFVLDALLQSQYSLTIDPYSWQLYLLRFVGIIKTNNNDYFSNSNITGEYSIISAILFYILGIAMTFILLFYPARQLLLISLSALHVFLIFVSYMMNANYISHYMYLKRQGTNVVFELYFLNKSTLIFFFINFFAQQFFVIISILSLYASSDFSKFVMCLHFNLPIILTFFTLPNYLLIAITKYCAWMEGALTAAYFFANCRHILLQFTRPLQRVLYYWNRDGIIPLLLSYVIEIRLWEVFREFWLIRLMKNASDFLYEPLILETRGSGIFTVISNNLVFALKRLICQSCDTFLSVVGMACIFSSMISFIVMRICNLLSLPQTSRQSNLQYTVMFIFLTLAVQNGLTGLIPNERLLRLYRNIIIIFAAVVQNVYEDVGNSLISLHESGNRPLRKHIKMLILVAVFLIYSCSMIVFLYTMHVFSPWLLASFTFNVDIAVRIIVSLVIYCLYGIELRSSDTWEGLNEYLFFVTSCRHVISFLCSVVLFFNGLYILFYESVGIIRTILMFIHFHLNIYLELKKGFSIFCRRQRANKTINLLREATKSQLIALDDKCTICREHLYHGKVTKCNHYFHKACLKSWLIELSVCPICHRDILPDIDQVTFDHEHQE